MKIAPILISLLLACAAAAAETPAIPDVKLTDQNGRSVRFYSDLVKGKVVAINFVFTSCTTICSPMGANFAALQQRLGDRSEVRLISVTIDPGMDTPERLKRWSDRFHAKPGWTLVTGARADVEQLLRALGAYTPDKFTHSPLVVVGDDARGVWTRGNGLQGPAALAAMIDHVRGRAEVARK
jgi:protein SCO1/2